MVTLAVAPTVGIVAIVEALIVVAVVTAGAAIVVVVIAAADLTAVVIEVRRSFTSKIMEQDFLMNNLVLYYL